MKDKDGEQIRAVVLDIDGTLSPQLSWLALTRDLGASVAEHSRIYEDYKKGLITYSESKRRLIGLWRSTGNANRQFLEMIFENWPLVDDALSIVKWLKERYTVCIITGSVDAYAKVITDKLGVDYWYANTKLEWRKGQLIGYDYHLDQAVKKLEQFQEFCASQELKPTQCIIVGDSENDLKLFDYSHRGILVGSNSPEEYRQHAWKVIDSLKELPTILNQT
jgi:HAD superfamily phosphoserine phosphatase-like hydrolase